MRSGVNNAPGIFQRVVDLILAKMKWRYALVYRHEVTIFSKTAVKHLDHARSVLKLWSEAVITLE